MDTLGPGNHRGGTGQRNFTGRLHEIGVDPVVIAPDQFEKRIAAETEYLA